MEIQGPIIFIGFVSIPQFSTKFWFGFNVYIHLVNGRLEFQCFLMGKKAWYNSCSSSQYILKSQVNLLKWTLDEGLFLGYVDLLRTNGCSLTYKPWLNRSLWTMNVYSFNQSNTSRDFLEYILLWEESVCVCILMLPIKHAHVCHPYIMCHLCCGTTHNLSFYHPCICPLCWLQHIVCLIPFAISAAWSAFQAVVRKGPWSSVFLGLCSCICVSASVAFYTCLYYHGCSIHCWMLGNCFLHGCTHICCSCFLCDGCLDVCITKLWLCLRFNWYILFPCLFGLRQNVGREPMQSWFVCCHRRHRRCRRCHCHCHLWALLLTTCWVK